MDLVQPFQYLQDHVVPGWRDRLPDNKPILCDCPPCYARGLAGLDGGQGDVSAEELLKSEKVVGEFGAGGKVGGRGWNNARVDGGGRWEVGL